MNCICHGGSEIGNRLPTTSLVFAQLKSPDGAFLRCVPIKRWMAGLLFAHFLLFPIVVQNILSNEVFPQRACLQAQTFFICFVKCCSPRVLSALIFDYLEIFGTISYLQTSKYCSINISFPLDKVLLSQLQVTVPWEAVCEAKINRQEVCRALLLQSLPQERKEARLSRGSSEVLVLSEEKSQLTHGKFWNNPSLLS